MTSTTATPVPPHHQQSVGVRSDRRLSLPVVNVDWMEYKERFRTSTIRTPNSESSTSKQFLDMNENDLPENTANSDHDSPQIPMPHRRRTYSTSDANVNFCVPEIVIEEAPPPSGDGIAIDSSQSHQQTCPNLRQYQRLNYKMDHLRIGDIVAEQVNEKQQKNLAVLLKRNELANEQMTKINAQPPASPTAGARRRSVPNLKSVLEEEQEDE